MTEFEEKVYKFLQTIPEGKVVTYGQIAYAIGHPQAARAVGNALHKNPDGDLYPCYKVLAASGALANDFVFGGPEAQAARLEAEGISVVDGYVDMDKYQW